MRNLAYLRGVIHIGSGVLGRWIQISLTFYRLFLGNIGSLLHVLVLCLLGGITRFGIVRSLNEVFHVACKVAHTAVELLLLAHHRLLLEDAFAGVLIVGAYCHNL
jgi:hypothetical protein